MDYFRFIATKGKRQERRRKPRNEREAHREMQPPRVKPGDESARFRRAMGADV